MVVKHKERKVKVAENPGPRSGSWQTTTARDGRCSDLGQLLVQTSTQLALTPSTSISTAQSLPSHSTHSLLTCLSTQ